MCLYCKQPLVRRWQLTPNESLWSNLTLQWFNVSPSCTEVQVGSKTPWHHCWVPLQVQQSALLTSPNHTSKTSAMLVGVVTAFQPGEIKLIVNTSCESLGHWYVWCVIDRCGCICAPCPICRCKTIRHHFFLAAKYTKIHNIPIYIPLALNWLCAKRPAEAYFVKRETQMQAIWKTDQTPRTPAICTLKWFCVPLKSNDSSPDENTLPHYVPVAWFGIMVMSMKNEISTCSKVCNK